MTVHLFIQFLDGDAVGVVTTFAHLCENEERSFDSTPLRRVALSKNDGVHTLRPRKKCQSDILCTRRAVPRRATKISPSTTTTTLLWTCYQKSLTLWTCRAVVVVVVVATQKVPRGGLNSEVAGRRAIASSRRASSPSSRPSSIVVSTWRFRPSCRICALSDRYVFVFPLRLVPTTTTTLFFFVLAVP